MLAVEALGQLPEERCHDPLELRGLRQLQYLLQLAKEQDLLLAVGHWPVLEQGPHDRLCQLRVLLHKLRSRVGKGRVSPVMQL